MRRLVGRLLLLLVLLLAPSLVIGASAQVQPVTTLNVTTGQQLADDCAAYERSNADTTLLVPATTTLHLANTTFSSVRDAEAVGGKAFAGGVLTIQGAGSESSVIDTGMRAGMLPPRPASSTALLVLSNLSITNICAVANVRGEGLIRVSQGLLGLLSMNSVVRVVGFNDLTLLVRQAEVAQQIYAMQMQRGGMRFWPTVRQRFAAQMDGFANMSPTVVHTSAHAVTLGSILTGGWVGQNLIMQSTSDPSDPLVQSMTKNGSLMPIRWCDNGTLVPPSVADKPYDAFWGPMWGTDTGPEAVAAMKQAAAVAAQQDAAQLPVPAVFINAPSVDLSDASVPDGIQLAAALQLWGPFNDDPTSLMPVPVLNLASRTAPLFNLSATGQLFLTRVILDGLAAQPLPVSSTAGTATTTQPAPPSALQLTTLAYSPTAAATGTIVNLDAPQPDAPINLLNVTLVLPVADYLALLTLATDGTVLSVRGCVDSQVLLLAALLSEGVQQLSLSVFALLQSQANLTDLSQTLPLSHYTGWGVNATQLVVVPATPVPATEVARCLLFTSPGAASGVNGGGAGMGSSSMAAGGSSTDNVGVIVGCVVGGAVLVALAAAGVTWLVMRRRGQGRGEAQGGLPLTDPPKQHGGGPAVWVSLALSQGGSGRHPAAQQQQQQQQQPTAAAAATAVVSAASASAMVSRLRSEERRLLEHTGPMSMPAPTRTRATNAAATAATGAGAGAGSAAAASASSAPEASSKRQQHKRKSSSGAAGIQPRLSSPDQQQQPRGYSGSAAASAASRSQEKPQLPAQQPEAPQSLLASAHELLLCSLQSQRGLLDLSAAAGPAVAQGSTQGTGGPLARVRALMLSHGGLQDAAKTANKVIIHRALGRGASGTVYVGEWRGLPVAVKTMVYDDPERDLPGPPDTSPVLETAISASVGHRNVVATYHYDIKRLAVHHSPHLDLEGAACSQPRGRPSEGPPSSSSTAGATFKVYLIQELCQSSLQRVLEDGPMYDPTSTLVTNQVMFYSLFSHIATGLEYLHGLNIIHGDLTPANVLLKLDRSERSGVVAKLTDFGLSRRLDQRATHVSNVVGGTPFYVAPEVVHRHRSSPAADVYSFGVILWQVLTGYAPFCTDDNGSCRPHPDFPTLESDEAKAMAPPPVQQLLHRCLLDDPHARPTATELREVLQAQLELAVA